MSQDILQPDDVFKQLVAGATSSRTKKSLEIIHSICKDQYERSSTDYSYSMIGKLSEEKGGPKAQPIRNATGAVYRTLIDTWAKFADQRTKKSSTTASKGIDDGLLALIDDSVARILVQNLLSDHRKLKYENQILKVAAKETVVINLAGKANESVSVSRAGPATETLLDQERYALRDAISPETLRKQGWAIDEKTGSVNKGPMPVFKPGFISAIKKIIEEA